MKLTIRRAIIVCSVLFLAIEGMGQTFKDLTYTSDDTNFPNPERGFYHHTEVKSSFYSLLNETELRGYRNEGITMIMRVFYLEKFVNAPLSSDYLDNVRQDFNIARKAGVKVITRFAYTTSSTAPFGDATPQQVLQHIHQLGPVLRENSDVIAVMQAGFIGAWGEWYYTDHFSQQIGNPSEADWVNRRAVVDAMLAELPSDRTIQVRTPQIKRKLVQSTTALTQGEAFANTERARLAHHNDCFLASPDDYGTYTNQTEEKDYLEAETQYLAMGGETCAPYVPLSECPNALAQMQRFHWSFINKDYNPDVVGGWNTNGCLDDVEKKVGYRFKLTSSHLQETSKPNGEVNFSFVLANEGWASPYNKRQVEIVLRNKSTNKEYRLTTSDDPRKWLPSGNIPVSITGGLPANIEEGDYAVFLNLNSPELAIKKRPEYSIRLANGSVWEETTGYNDLHHTLVVSAGASVPTYSGSSFFLTTDVLPQTLPTPSGLISSSFGTNVLLYWGHEDGEAYRVIERSESGGDFSTIATLTPDVFSYIDEALDASVTYTYRSYSTDGSAISPFTSEIDAETTSTTPPFYTHRTDGSIDEWASIRPLQTLQDNNNTYAFRLFADKDSLYFHIRGEFTNYELSLDTDNDGDIDWTSDGSVKTKRSGVDLEGAVLLSELTNLGSNILLRASLQIDALFLPAEGTVDFVRSMPPAIIQQLGVEVSGPFLLIVSWKKCTECLGVILERSKSSDKDFVQVKQLNNSTYIYYDTDVVTGTPYYYRAAGYNETGLSDYTEVVSGTPNVVTTTGLLTGDESNLVYPNPVSDVMTLRWKKEYRTVMMYDVLGRPVYTELLNETRSERKYDVSRLAAGLYYVRISGDQGVISVSIKK